MQLAIGNWRLTFKLVIAKVFCGKAKRKIKWDLPGLVLVLVVLLGPSKGESDFASTFVLVV